MDNVGGVEQKTIAEFRGSGGRVALLCLDVAEEFRLRGGVMRSAKWFFVASGVYWGSRRV